ncbi:MULTISPECIES: hypothetical protein [Sphingomonas]|uniref:hypothetical protein n=1 Tax=Sphingomonas TaxID=13687 RepID=UPI0019647EAC|nr:MULTISPECIES: hypothetical protein [Sphingomonas]
MGPIAYVIAILGCADGSSAACTPVATMPTRYESRASCDAAAAAALTQNTDVDYPTVVAECRRATTVPAAQRLERSTPLSVDHANG